MPIINTPAPHAAPPAYRNAGNFFRVVALALNSPTRNTSCRVLNSAVLRINSKIPNPVKTSPIENALVIPMATGLDALRRGYQFLLRAARFELNRTQASSKIVHYGRSMETSRP